MKGTEKQIKWAEDIKAKAMSHLRDTYAMTDNEQCNINNRIAITCWANSIDDAKTWIDNRNKHYEADPDWMWYYGAYIAYCNTQEGMDAIIAAGAKF